MRSIGSNEPCPCNTGRKFRQCCEPAITGKRWPDTPEALMRSRYTAYVTGAVDHLYRTTHPDHDAVRGKSFSAFAKETLPFCRAAEFMGLTIHEVHQENEAGITRVRFTAQFRVGAKQESMTELSDFVRQKSKWVYRSGT